MDLGLLYFAACARPTGIRSPGWRLSDGVYGEIGVTTNGGIFKCEMMKTAG
jgi:hypothetical protein